jgi:DNA modification methylase
MTVRVITGDALTELAKLPAESVHCCVCSPPYYGLRDYQTATWEGGDPACDHKVDSQSAAMKQKRSTLGPNRDGLNPDNAYFKGVDEVYRAVCGKCGARRIDAQLGLEATPDAYVAAMVGVFREVRRVLRADGTCWINLGDSYASGGRATYRSGASDNKGQLVQNDMPRPTDAPGIKPKDLLGIPWLLAFALRADGWWLRQDIIWAKPNPMPESVTDRCTKAHEYVFLLSKSERYYFDAAAIAEPAVGETEHDLTGQGYLAPGQTPQRGSRGRAAGNKTHKFVAEYEASDSEEHRTKAGLLKIADTAYPTRNKRSVWTIATQPNPFAHFAMMPEKVAEPCVLAGTSEKGVCPSCGAPWVRQSERVDQGYDGSRYGERAVVATGGAKTGGTARSTLGSSNGKLTGKSETMGWRPSCRCSVSHGVMPTGKQGAAPPTNEPPPPIPATVLDPFLGAGTTALVADRLGRNAIGIELSPEYAEMARRRLEADAGMFAQVAAD